jgi:hypothetical protein
MVDIFALHAAWMVAGVIAVAAPGARGQSRVVTESRHRVYYSLTDAGRGLPPVVGALHDWAARWIGTAPG